MYRFGEYNSLNFDADYSLITTTTIWSRDRHSHYLRKFPPALLQSNDPSRGYHYINFYHIFYNFNNCNHKEASRD